MLKRVPTLASIAVFVTRGSSRCDRTIRRPGLTCISPNRGQRDSAFTSSKPSCRPGPSLKTSSYFFFCARERGLTSDQWLLHSPFFTFNFFPCNNSIQSEHSIGHIQHRHSSAEWVRAIIGYLAKPMAWRPCRLSCVQRNECYVWRTGRVG